MLNPTQRTAFKIRRRGAVQRGRGCLESCCLLHKLSSFGHNSSIPPTPLERVFPGTIPGPLTDMPAARSVVHWSCKTLLAGVPGGVGAVVT